MKVNLKCGPSLEINKICGGGYVMAPIGAVFLGGVASRDLVGKYVVWVQYADGEDGQIPQEEILSIEDNDGELVEYGSPKFPGHPDYDPRTAPDPYEDAIRHMKKAMDRKMENFNKLNMDANPFFGSKNKEDSEKDDEDEPRPDDNTWPNW